MPAKAAGSRQKPSYSMNENDVILIERYLDNVLADNERTDVEKRIETDREFADLLTFLRDVKVSVTYGSKKELQIKLARIAEEYERHHNQEKGSTGGRIVRFRHYAVAASLTAVLVIAGILLFFDNDKPTMAEGKDLQFIRNYMTANPGKSDIADAEILPYELIEHYGSLPAHNIDSLSLGKLPVVVIRETQYENAYFLSDTLYLFGNFGANPLLFQQEGNHKDTLWLKRGLVFYKLADQRTDTIMPLEKINSNLKTMPQHEN